MRSFCLFLCVVSVGLIFTPASADEKKEPRPRQPVQLTDEALQIHNEALLLDGHNDLPYMIADKGDRSFQKLDIAKPQPKLHTDIPRLKKGNVGAQFWSAYVDADPKKKGTAVRDTLEQIDVIHRMAHAYPDAFEMAYSTEHN